MEENKWVKKFEDYFNGDLDDREINSFEAALSEDAALKKQYIEFAETMEALSCIATRSKLASNPEFRKAIAQGMSGKNKGSGRSGWIFAALALALIIAFFLWWKYSYADNPDYESTQDLSAEMAEVSHEKMIGWAVEYAGKGPFNYDLTRGNDFNDSTVQYPDQLEICREMILSEQFNSAVGCLVELSDYSELPEYPWFLGLAHLGNNNRAKASEFIDQVASDRFNEYFSLAKELQKVLNWE